MSATRTTASRGARARPCGRLLPSVLAGGLLLASAQAHAAPALSCQARRSGDRVVVSVELRQLVEPETRRLIELGLKGQVRVDGSVVRRHWGLFERVVGAATAEAEIAGGADGRGLVLNGRRQTTAEGSLPLERVTVRLTGRPRPEETLTFRATVQLRVVTASSLAKVAAWATESSEEQSSSSVVTRALLSAVAEDLTRTAECSCAAAPQ